jgi:PTS system ascorbate-specific IIA component
MNVGILIIAHHPLASALQSVVGHIYPEALGRVLALDVLPAQSAPEILDRAKELVDQLETYQKPVLVFTDASGATPCNLAVLLSQQRIVRIVSGVNIPMIWRTLNYSKLPIDELIECAISGGIQCIQEIETSSQRSVNHE